MGKWILVVALALGMGGMVGCGLLDWITGAGTPENPGTDADAPVGVGSPK